MHPLPCATIWGGIRNENIDICSKAVEASLYSSSAAGGEGGDIYYLSVCGEDLLTRVALADVTGHGHSVTDVSQWLYDSLVARMGDLDGDLILSDLNRLAMERGIDALATSAIASFYAPDSNVYFSYAGHHPMLIHRSGGSRWEPAELVDPRKNANIPLGVVADAVYDQKEVRVHSGDRLLLYTDGLTEAPRDDGERFGEARLRDVLDKNASADLMALKKAVLEAALEFSGGSFEHDDVTLIAVQIR